MVNKNDLNVCTLTKCVQTIKILLIFHQILTKLQVSELRHFCPYTIVASICV